jgi:hypothetical protein
MFTDKITLKTIKINHVKVQVKQRQQTDVMNLSGNVARIKSKSSYLKTQNVIPYRDGGAVQGRFQVGIYTITPAYGLILQNGHQAITIDCAPEVAGKFEEELVIDITDRNVNQYPHGLIYKFSVEAVIPSITITPDIFEEHTVIQNVSALDSKTVSGHVLILILVIFLLKFSKSFRWVLEYFVKRKINSSLIMLL